MDDINKLLLEHRKPEYKAQMLADAFILVKRQLSDAVSEDTFIIQAISSIGDLDRICNTLTKRMREWYGYYYPEFAHKVQDNEAFIRRIIQKSKSELMTEYSHTEPADSKFKEKDINEMINLAKRINDLYDEREKLITYIDNIMLTYCPNVYTITGAIIGAKLLEKAGSLKHLSQMPSSTVQLLGAEKALFRHLRNKKIRPPKHGLILSHNLVIGAPRNKKGTAARVLAAKISIAAKVDYFHGEFIGDTLLENLKKKLGQ